MKLLNFIKRVLPAVVMLLLLLPYVLRAQTDEDAIMMAKKNFCGGPFYSHSSWKDYWEGTFKRNNQNLGTVSTHMVGLMGDYGVSRKLNILVNAPYVWTHASAGTLHGQQGVQDLSIWIKWMAVEQNVGDGMLSLFTIGGASLPMTNYVADFLPLSIGLQAKTLSGRLMADYQLGKFFVTASGTYTWRSNITIDRNSYYTTEEHLTNKVYMPDMSSFNFRTGYRSERLIAEAVLAGMTTLGGFDIRKNDMPFPSNKMNATMAGVNFRYYFKVVNGLSVMGGGNYTIAGRNTGQAMAFNTGVFYILDFSRQRKTTSHHATKTN